MRPRPVGLKTRLLLAALELASFAAGVVPRHTVAEPICRALGIVWYLLSPAARDAVRDNLRHILGRQPTRRQIVSVFQNGMLSYWDLLVIPHFSLPGVLDMVDIHGAELVAAGLEQGRGVVVCTGHLGSVSFVGQIFPAMGYKISGLLEPLEPPELYDFFASKRRALGANLLPVSTGALRELLLALRRNELLGLVTDRDVTGTGPYVQFFDAPTRFPDGPAALALRTGAPVLIAMCTRKADGRFDAWINQVPPVPLTGDTKEDVLRLTRAIASGLQYHIANHPEQWTVFQKRWPPGMRP